MLKAGHRVARGEMGSRVVRCEIGARRWSARVTALYRCSRKPGFRLGYGPHDSSDFLDRVDDVLWNADTVVRPHAMQDRPWSI